MAFLGTGNKYMISHGLMLVPRLSCSLYSFDPLGKLGIGDLHQVQTATWAVRAEWYNCGLALGVSSDTLDAVKKDNPKNCGDCFTETLKEWLKGANPSPTWSALCNALESPSVGYI